MPVQSALFAMRAKMQSFSRTGFVRSVGVLVGGTAFAQALNVLVLPIITRLYAPDDFTVFAVYVSVLTIISVVACLRLEIAIPMPERDEDAANLLALALCSSFVVTILTALAVWLFPRQIVDLVGQAALRPYLWLLPLGIWLTSSHAAIQFWSTRKRKFGTIAKTRMTQAIGGAGSQVGLGWAGFAPLGLLLGYTISSGAGLLALGRDAVHEDRAAFRGISWSGMRRTLRQYDRFPKYSTFEAVANSAGIQLPVVIIAALVMGPEAGYLALAARVMAAPMGLIGGSIAQVYLSRAPEELRAGTLGSFSAEVLGGLLRTGVGPLLFIGILAPQIFSVLFGQNWERAGEIVMWMTPWFIFQLMSSPISMVMHITGRQRPMLALTVSGLAIRLGAMGLAAHFARDHFSEFYAISGGLFYIVCCWMFSRAAGMGIKDLIRTYRAGSVSLIGWTLIAVILRIILKQAA
ncbi:lipopolysaccharide biosynthesis protein [Variovorax sp. J22R115]|uniref:lipopolysaccharide biosynthesis protein n=1 Tax=Variovorax sp. J22R115 TaxID=3053509 RepID=UPI002578B3F1|nr:oligosaccharide flippase family protein [Variovorax sp. J22R115]MDM0053464.1 oligosaccharide flippase family protein [Variovorax sp. J22R115]